MMCTMTAWTAPGAAPRGDDLTSRPISGYRGIWYMNQPTHDEYRFKYSGGFATYPQQHIPIALHVPAQKKTYFVFGGSAAAVERSSARRHGRPAGSRPGLAGSGTGAPPSEELQHVIGYYDHAAGTVSRPVCVLQKRTADAHDNPTLSIDSQGHLYVFSASHGVQRDAYLHRSKRPYDITAWERVFTVNFSYPQPWYLPQSRRMLFLHTLYQHGQRTLQWRTSSDGRHWAEPQLLAHLEMGSYQISARQGETDRVGTVFDLHPSWGRAGTGLNFRTNLYYLETRDGGATWTTVDGSRVEPPLTEAANPALVHDYRAEDLSVYLKDLAFTPDGHPVVLYLTSQGFAPGPRSGPYQWRTARWTGAAWEIQPFTMSDHNYDHGSLYIENDGTWRVIAPTAPGPQPNATGGDVIAWISRDQGRSWRVAHELTRDSRFNHTYVRKPVGAHSDFYALWADGSPWERTPSSLYFATRDGSVFRLPERIRRTTTKPEQLR